MKQWKRLAALSSAVVMAAATLTYFPSDTLQNIRLEISASAETTTEPQVWIEDNLTWTLDADGKLTISGTGAMKDYSSSEGNRSPAHNNSNVKKVVIEDGVTSIGNQAFPFCKKLASVTIPDSVTSIENYAFYECSSLTDIVIPNSVTSIGNSVFERCSNLSNITLSNNITSIGSGAFTDCRSLPSITIPDSVTSIGGNAFSDCRSLTSITIPDKVTSIEYAAFDGCSRLTSITIPDSITSIGDFAFRYCKSLPSITIPDSVTSIGNSAFFDCSSLTSITIPDSVTSIGNYAFRYCSSLTNITIPDSVTSIGNYAFRYCKNLPSITIPDSVTSIGTEVFQECTSLQTISLSCKSTLKKSDFGEQADLVSYTNQHALTKTAAKTATCSESGNKEYWTCEHCGKYFLSDDANPATATAVEQSETVIPASHKLTKVDAKAATCSESGNKEYWTCEHCKQYFLSDDTNPETAKAVELSETVIPASHKLTKVEAKAVTCAEDGNKEYWTCEHCGKYFLSDDANPETAKAVEQSEFIIPASHKLTKVKEEKAPTCTEDGNKEYWTCEHCKKYFLSDDTNPKTAKAVELSETILPAIKHKNAIIRDISEPTETDPGYSGDRYCPDCNTVLEKGYTYWNEDNLTWRLYEDGTLTISGIGAMKNYDTYLNGDNLSPVDNNTKIKKVVIEKNVTSIGNYAFSRCWNLKSITISDDVTSIGDYAFDSCINLRSITIPDSITSIGMFAFRNCWNVPSITIPDGVTSIEDSTFNSCISLTSITIPNSVTKIENSAFHNCAGLTSITIPDSVTSIGNSVFNDCNSLKTISLSCGSALKKSDFGEQADLVSYTNQHALIKTAAKAETCTEDGNKEYWTCEHCGKYFLSDDTNPETAKAVERSETIIPASHKLTKVEAKAPTCTEDGNKEYWTCEHCKKYFLSDDTNPETAKAVEQAETILPALKHKNAIIRDISEPTKTAPGYSGDRYCPDCNTVLEKGYTYWIEDNLTWKLYEDGTLNISGTGTMKNYTDYNSSRQSPVFDNDTIKNVVIEDGVTSIGDFAFSNCSGLTSITIPKSVTSIGAYAFSNCDGLTSITIPKSVTSIGSSAFADCSSLTSITIPDSVISIGNFAFEWCSNLSSITLSNNITSIGTFAFNGCSSLTSITISDSVTSIGKFAFDSCSNLKTISLSCKSSLKRSDFGKQADLVSYTSHVLKKTAAKAETCTEDGNKEYWTCEHCGKYFLSDDTNPETAKAVERSETIIPASHKLTKVKEEKAPTCTEDGNKEYWTCEHCKKYFLSDDTNPETAKAVELSETILSALKHKNAIIRDISEPTKTAPGYSGDRYCPDCDTVLEKGYTYWIEDNLTWKLYEDGTLNISGTGAMKDYNYNDNKSPVSNNSNVKKVVIEKGVTSIGNYAFYCCLYLTSITIPNSVTSIGNSAFSSCLYLTSITIPDGVTSIGNYAFYSCSSLTSIMIPDSVTSIGNSAFSYCRSLTSITIPDSVTSIENWTFNSCSSLTSITIPDSVTSIGNSAFSDCSSLTSITIPDSVTNIGNSVFYNCSSLTSITIPDSVTSIGYSAFYNCSSLTSITIPDSVTSIGNRAFSNCSSLTSITIPDSVTSIEATAFDSCSNLKTISLSCKSSLKRNDFGEQADLVSYTSHVLKKTAAKAATCTEDGNKEYWTCEHCGKYFLSDDTNPETAKAVEQSETIIPASHKLTKVKEEKAPTCTEDGNKEYWTCEHCKKYFLSDDTNPETAKAVELSETILPAIQHKNETIRGASKPDGTKPGYSGDRYCPDCDTVLEKGYTYWVEDNLTWKLYADGTLNISGTGAMKNYSHSEDNQSPAYNNSNVKKVVIEDGVTSIGDYAFWNCSNLTNITIPNGVASIGNLAFQFCSNLISVTIPDSVTNIETSAFDGCSSLTSITIPESVTSIQNYAFHLCNGLTSVIIPDSVISIGSNAFSDCINLKTIFLSCKSTLKKSSFGEQADLVSYTNQHALTKTAAKAATCTEDGNKEYWTCEHCGKYFLSDDTNPETAKAVEQAEFIIPASHKLTKVEAKAATCTEDGNIEYWQCDVCKKTFTDKDGKNAVNNVIIAALKHNYNENGFCENDDIHYQPADYNEEIEKYEISNAGQLYWFAEQVNSGNTSVNAVLTADIVVNENVLTADGSLGADPDHLRMWRPIGDTTKNTFKGTFDGKGHTISGLYFHDSSNKSGVDGAGLFGASNGIIQNVGLEDSYLNHYNFSAGICAENNGQIRNCYNIGRILGNSASGICEYNNGKIENCYNAGAICGFRITAGICNANAGILKDCYNNSDITVLMNSATSYTSGICNINSNRIENCYHVGQVDDVISSNNICNLNKGQIENSYYDRMVCDKDAIGQNDSSAIAKNVEGKSTEQFTSGEVTYLLNGDQSALAFYQNLAAEKYPTLNQKSKVVMQLEMIYDESFGEDATTNKTYHNAGDTIALETSPDKAYTYQYFVNGKQIEESTYTLTGNTKMTVKKVPVEIELSESVRDTIQLTYQKKTTLDLTAYLKNFADLKPMQFQLDADSKLPEGLTLTKNGVLSGTPEKAAETVKTTLILTAKNGTTKKMELTFHIAKADPTVEVAVSGDSHTEGDLVDELELILSENSTKGVVEIVSKIKALVAGKNTFTWKFTPEDENNYNTITGTVVVNAQTTTTTTTTVTTTTTKPSKTTTTKATATTKPSKTTTTKATVTTKPSKTTTTKATITTKPSKTTTTKATATTKPSKTTTTKATATTKPNKTTTMSSVTTTNTGVPSYGDVNLDGKVDLADAIFLNKYFATLIQFSDVQAANADCYQDGVLNEKDATALMQFILLLIDDLPV